MSRITRILLCEGLIDRKLLTITDKELMRCRGCGEKTVRELRQIINIIKEA